MESTYGVFRDRAHIAHTAGTVVSSLPEQIYLLYTNNTQNNTMKYSTQNGTYKQYVYINITVRIHNLEN